MFSRVRFTDVDRKKLKTLVAIAAVQFVQRRDLAHKRWSGDAPELEQNMLFAVKG